METTAAPKTANAGSLIPAMRVLIKGRIERQRRHESKTYTHVTCPAADAYSQPQKVEIRSKARLGDVGEEVTISCVLGGYGRKSYQVTDKDTGERITVYPVEHTLDAVE